jgi:hypothetical protein
VKNTRLKFSCLTKRRLAPLNPSKRAHRRQSFELNHSLSVDDRFKNPKGPPDFDDFLNFSPPFQLIFASSLLIYISIPSVSLSSAPLLCCRHLFTFGHLCDPAWIRSSSNGERESLDSESQVSAKSYMAPWASRCGSFKLTKNRLLQPADALYVGF